MPLVQTLEHLLRNLELLRARLVALGFLFQTRDGLVERADVGQDELGLDGFHVGGGVDLAVHMDHVGVAEEAHDLADGVGLADVREELVAQALALARAFHQTRDVDELHRRRDDLRGMVDLRELIEARIGDGHDAHVGLDGRERVVRREAALVGERREQGRFADVGQPDDTDGKRHGNFLLIQNAAAISRDGA